MNPPPLPIYKSMLKNVRDDAPRNHRYSHELKLKEMILKKDPSCIEYMASHFCTEHFPQLSSDPALNRIMVCTSVITLIVRFCIEGGLSEFYAYGIGNTFLKKLHINLSEEQVFLIMSDAVNELIKLLPDYPQSMGSKSVDQLALSTAYSPLVNKAIYFILTNIRTHLSTAKISDMLFCSADYLSHIFRLETGCTITRFIHHHKTELAKEMLLYSNFPISEISVALSFSNTSHFIKIFQEETGMTPGKYRSTYGNETFKSEYWEKMY